jgi:hypothetical protein
MPRAPWRDRPDRDPSTRAGKSPVKRYSFSFVIEDCPGLGGSLSRSADAFNLSKRLIRGIADQQTLPRPSVFDHSGISIVLTNGLSTLSINASSLI